MTWLTKPHHLQLKVVIIVMGNRLLGTASFARHAFKLSRFNCPCNRVMSSRSTPVLLPPDLCDFNGCIDSLLSFPSVPVVFTHLVKVIFAVLGYIIFGTRLALI